MDRDIVTSKSKNTFKARLNFSNHINFMLSCDKKLSHRVKIVFLMLIFNLYLNPQIHIIWPILEI
ncbi:hypothetical protein BpHYR1_044537 [Brachionus plicatilis]|uniref:Uncharacterized protein n=1 Tax=Brachionus plicatilis TaxID=10195 RepID=A0A3M7P5Y8_BRAPC|nr:hypothetical protein BpHYR1_044537 [Brachionus plicatilis]